MREIKFRAWDKNNKKMIYVEDAKSSKNLLAIGFHGLPIAVDSDSFKGDEVTGWNIDHYITPMQFTGILDTYRHEIYECDIVKWEIEDPLSGIYTVMWYEYGWFLEGANGRKEPLYANLADGRGSTLQVVGNVYENPDLLKELQMSTITNNQSVEPLTYSKFLECLDKWRSERPGHPRRASVNNRTLVCLLNSVSPSWPTKPGGCMIADVEIEIDTQLPDHVIRIDGVVYNAAKEQE